MTKSNFLQSWVLFTLCWLMVSLAYAATPLKITITGVEADVRDNIQLRLESAFNAYGNSPDQWQRFTDHLEENITKAIQPYGYFQAKATSHVNQTDKTVHVAVTPGKQLLITRMIVRIVGPGLKDPKYLTLLNNFPLQTGDPLRIDNYNEAKKHLFFTAQTQGYLKARMVQNTIKINLQDYTATVLLYFDTGPRYYFGNVTFNNNPFSPRFLTRYIPFRYEDPYSTAELLKLQDSYNSSGYFDQVVVNPDLDHIVDRHVPVTVNLVPRKGKLYTFGVGYDGTQKSLRGILGLEMRHLTPTGHHVQALAQGSFIQSSASASYIIPGKNPLTDEYNISVSVFREDLNDLDAVAAQVGVGYQSQWHEWQRVIGVTGLLERQYNTILNIPTRTTNWIYPSLNLRTVHADHPFNSERGFLLNILMQGGNRHLLSDANFLQMRVDGKLLHTLPNQTRVLLRGTGGITVVDNIYSLAPALQFRAGGAQSVRGYTYRSLGPGKYLAMGSVELQHPIVDKWRAALFYDFGNAFNHSPMQLQQSIGMGVVWVSAVGSINLGIAARLGRHSMPLQLVFSMGPDLS